MAGWYPDPDNNSQLRYWDGTTWTDDISPVTGAGWSPPAEWQPPAPSQSMDTAPLGPPPMSAQPMGAPPAGYAAYAPQSGPLTASGMRRIGELFNDAGRIIRRAWWQIIVLSLIIWLVLGAMVVAALALLVDIPAMRATLDEWFGLIEEYPNGRVPNSALSDLGEQFLAALRTDSPAVWITLGTLAFLAVLVATCVQVAGINRLAMDAASGQPVSLGAGWRSAFVGGFRLLGYWILLGVGITLVAVVWLLLIVATASVPGLAVVIGIFGWLAYMVLAIWLGTRLIPLSAQVVVARGALRWSWEATRGRFFAVLGRYLLWAVIASVIGQVILGVVFFPMSLFMSAALASSDPGTSLGWAALMYAIMMPVSMAVTALTMIGVVPIWRDLTDHPIYRSIGPDGVPVTVP